MKRWCVYLAVLGCSIGLYVAVSGWPAWVLLLTVASLPLFSVAVRLLSAEKTAYDSLGLFRFPAAVQEVAYAQVLRPYQPGDHPGRVHWKLWAKTGAMTVREEVILPPPAALRPRAVVPIMLCLGVVLCLFPPGKYAQQMAFLQNLLLRPHRQTAAYVDLGAAGPVAENRQAVLDVVVSQSQLLYLRGQAFDIYDGRFWRGSDWKDDYWPDCDPEGGATVSIATRGVLGIRYFPYYIAGEECRFVCGALENDAGLQEYTYRQQKTGRASGKQIPKQCLQLRSETRAWAEGVLDALFGEERLSETEKVEKIQNFVRNCAIYDKNTPKMSQKTDDFARWFVENGRGYCVHFATAAAVLLRCAGIPARFVTGFAVEVQAGVRKTVVGSDAHAWVEYLEGGVWRVLEATPTKAAAEPVEMRPAAQGKGYGGALVLVGVVMLVLQIWVLLRRRLLEEDVSQLKELAQKAAYSRDGLTPEEEKLYRAHLRKLPRHKRAVYRIFRR